MATLRRIRYCLGHGRFLSPAARLRATYWSVLRRWETELCQECGRPVRQVWWCSDDRLWERVTGNRRRPRSREPASGIRCIRCFDEAVCEDSEAGWVEWAPVNLRHIGDPPSSPRQEGKP